MREQAKKLTNTKRNQQIERERHAAALSEMKQQCDDSDEKQVEIKVKVIPYFTHPFLNVFILKCCKYR